MHLDELPRFLSVQELTDELARYSYRPGWDLQILEDPFEGAFLYVRAQVENAYRPGEFTPLYIRTLVPPIPDADYFGWWLWWRLDLIERHECREFLRRDGVVWRDPHDPAEPRKPDEPVVDQESAPGFPGISFRKIQPGDVSYGPVTDDTSGTA